MKTPSERGVTGAWAYQARQEAGLSVEQVAEKVSRLGQAVSPATIRGIESGSKKPGARLLRLLGQALDSTAPGASAAVVDDPVAHAIGEQTAALAQLVEQMAARLDASERRADALEAIVMRLAAAPQGPQPEDAAAIEAMRALGDALLDDIQSRARARGRSATGGR